MGLTNPNAPDMERALSTPSDVEALISGAFYSYWRVTHRAYPDAALGSAADSHSSGWGSWGMQEAGAEPRRAFNNDPAWGYNEMTEAPWRNAYAALTAVRDGLRAIEEGVTIRDGSGRDVTRRAVAFGKLVQALSLSTLAVFFDKAFVVDETTDLEKIGLLGSQSRDSRDPPGWVPYQEVWAAAEMKYDEAIAEAQGADFTIPKAWVGNHRDWSAQDFVGFTRAFRARFRTQIPRTPAERAGADWHAVLADLSGGLPFDFGGYYDGVGVGWWDRKKLHLAGINGFIRTDNRTLGPGDVSGAWKHWLVQPPHLKEPFEILTPDARITRPMEPTTDGTYFTYKGNSPFPVSYGIYHFSHYIDHRYNHLWEGGYVGFYPDFVEAEVDFLRAEALYRTGNVSGAMAIVNRYRANGQLPPFTDPGLNPDGPDRCVPQMPDGSCGDLWEALKYEKRIECFHHSFGVEFFDDRGWGDLVENTWIHLPAPGRELQILMLEIYTFGGPDDPTAAPGGGVTPDILDDFSSRALAVKRRALERFREATEEPLDPGPPG